MQSFDFKSGVIGFLSAALLAVCFGAGQPGGSVVPRYQIMPSGVGDILVLDSQTNTISLLYPKEVPGKHGPDRPWANDSSFSLEDALSKPEGAQVKHGPGYVAPAKVR